MADKKSLREELGIPTTDYSKDETQSKEEFDLDKMLDEHKQRAEKGEGVPIASENSMRKSPEEKGKKTESTGQGGQLKRTKPIQAAEDPKSGAEVADKSKETVRSAPVQKKLAESTLSENGETRQFVRPVAVPGPEERKKEEQTEKISSSHTAHEKKSRGRVVKLDFLGRLKKPQGEPVENPEEKAADLTVIEEKIRNAKKKLSLTIEEFEEIEGEDEELPDFLDEAETEEGEKNPVKVKVEGHSGRREKRKESTEEDEQPAKDSWDELKDRDEIRKRLHKLVGVGFWRVAGALILTLALVYFGLSQSIALPVPAFWCKATAPQGFAIFNFVATALLMLLAGASFSTAPAGRKRQKQSFFLLLFVAGGMVLVENTVQMFAATQTVTQPLFNSIYAISSFLLILSEYSMDKKLRADYRFLTAKGERSELSFERESSVYEDGDYISAVLHPADDTVTEHFFERSTTRSRLERKMVFLLAVLVPIAIVIAACAAGKGGIFGFLSGLSLAGCLILPPSLALSGSMPFSTAFSGLRKKGAVVLGYDAAVTAADTDEVAVRERDIFRKNQMKFCGIKIYNNVQIDEMIIKAASVLRHMDSSLYDLLLEVMDGKEELLEQVEEYEPTLGEGVRATVNGSRVLIGTRAFLKECMVRVPGDGLAEKLHSTGKYPLYVACDGVVGALLSFGYAPDEKLEAELRYLMSQGVAVKIYSDNPILTSEMFEKVYRIPTPVEIVPCEKQQGMTSRGGIVTDKMRPQALIQALTRCIKFSSMSGVLRLIGLLNIVFGVVMALILVLAGSISAVPLSTVFFIQLFWLIPVIGILLYTKFSS